MINDKILDAIFSYLGEDSFFIVDLDKFRENYQSFFSSFKQRYSNVNIGYSYKTNYTPSICKIVQDEGGYAEVVSDMEYNIAKELGVKGERIIFNGPVKERHALVKAIEEGALINIDSIEEFKLLKKIYLQKTGLRQARLGIRCNFPIETNEHSRFGIDVESSGFNNMVREMKASPYFLLEGLHCHFSTSSRSTSSFGERTERLLQTVDRVFENTPKFIDIGGGFFGKLGEEFEEYFGIQAPAYDDYAEAIIGKIKRKYPDEEPEIILEPGTALVADVFAYACRVQEIKKIRNRLYAQTFGSVHTVKPTGNTRNVPFHIIRNLKLMKQEDIKSSQPMDIVGYTCMEHDVICRDVNISLKKNDFLLFPNMGSYTTVFKPPFIKGGDSIYAIKGDSTFLTKKKETCNDLLATYVY